MWGESRRKRRSPGADVGAVQSWRGRQRALQPPSSCGRAPAQLWAQPRMRASQSRHRSALSSPGQDVGESRRRRGRIRPLGSVESRTHSVYPPPKPMGVWLCARACMLVCARALVWLTFYPDIELASLLPLCERDTHGNGGSRVSGSAYVRARRRARATARALVRACVYLEQRWTWRRTEQDFEVR